VISCANSLNSCLAAEAEPPPLSPPLILIPILLRGACCGIGIALGGCRGIVLVGVVR
jgi:hypothetical protein